MPNTNIDTGGSIEWSKGKTMHNEDYYYRDFNLFNDMSYEEIPFILRLGIHVEIIIYSEKKMYFYLPRLLLSRI